MPLPVRVSLVRSIVIVDAGMVSGNSRSSSWSQVSRTQLCDDVDGDPVVVREHQKPTVTLRVRAIAHEPLVDDEAFVAVPGLRVAKPGGVRRYLVAGLVVCARRMDGHLGSWG